MTSVQPPTTTIAAAVGCTVVALVAARVRATHRIIRADTCHPRTRVNAPHYPGSPLPRVRAARAGDAPAVARVVNAAFMCEDIKAEGMLRTTEAETLRLILDPVQEVMVAVVPRSVAVRTQRASAASGFVLRGSARGTVVKLPASLAQCVVEDEDEGEKGEEMGVGGEEVVVGAIMYRSEEER